MIDAPRIHVLSSTDTFDGTTDLATLWGPKPDANNPRLYATQATVGRISFAQLLRSGTAAAFVFARVWDGSSALTMGVRTAQADEIAKLSLPDNPTPFIADSLISSTALSAAWSAAILVGPTDALTFEGTRNTVELLVIEVGSQASIAYLNGVLAMLPATTTTVMLVTTNTVITAPMAADVVILAEPLLGTTINIQVPDAAQVTAGRTVKVVRGNGFGGVTVNGVSNINDSSAKIHVNGGVDLVQRGGLWMATQAPVVPDFVLTNAVADASVNIPSIGAGMICYQVNFTARGVLVWPDTAGVEIGTKIALVRYGDGATTPCRARVAPNAVGDRVNGTANASVYLGQADGSVGALLLGERVEGGWIVTGDRQIDAMQVITLAADTTLDSGWVGIKVIRATQAGAQTITGPAAAVQVAGCGILLVGVGAGGVTFAPNGITIRHAGATPANIAVAQNATILIFYTGSEYIYF